MRRAALLEHRLTWLPVPSAHARAVRDEQPHHVHPPGANRQLQRRLAEEGLGQAVWRAHAAYVERAACRSPHCVTQLVQLPT